MEAFMEEYPILEEVESYVTDSSISPSPSAVSTQPSEVDSTDYQHGGQESELDGNDLEPIAICGFSIKFPQDATSPEAFWKMMCERRCAMSEFPESRINLKGFYREKNKRNTLPVRGGHFLKEDLGVFDADFFSISPQEAAAMDPMQRWLLEAAYHAFENAGMPMESVTNSSTSVYTGSFGMDYMLQLCRDAEQPPTYAAYGFGLSMLANRLSWFFNLRGASIGVDSACSSTMMALDMACQALRNKSCDQSLVAGCNMTFSPESYTWMSNINFLGPDSRCHSFDHRANGYARGEGIGVMVVKRLSDALRDGNTIRAVIRSTGSNEDGRTPGITQPSRTAQEEMIRATYQKAGLSMAHTRYFEAHGTGTPIGDPREAQAIGTSFQKYRSVQDPIYIGAVKSNIGHLEGASGLAGVIKALLVLEKGVIPPNTNFEKVNPKIDTEYLRVKFPEKCVPWPTQGLRRASVNSFGYGGANSHVILDDAYNYLRLRNLSGKHCTALSPPSLYRLFEAPIISSIHTSSVQDPSIVAQPKLLVWSAADQRGVGRLVNAYEDHFASKSFTEDAAFQYLDDLAYTLDSRRSKLSWRSFAVADSLDDLQHLSSILSSPTRALDSPPRVGFAFTGQGAQWFAMGRELKAYYTFMSSLETADLYLKQLGCSWSAVEELSRSEETSRIDDPEFSQTLCTVLQVALVDLLCEFGVKPVAVVGHSSGEIAAAYCAGAFSKESAWKLAYFRGVLSAKLARLSCSQTRGSMMSVGLSEEEARTYLLPINQSATGLSLTIACINSPKNVTISGEEKFIDEFKHQMDEKNIFARKLRVPLAYHSRQMEAIAEEYLQNIGILTTRRLEKGECLFISSVTGTLLLRDHLIQPSYWVQNLVSPVQFTSAVLGMCEKSSSSLIKKIDRSHLSVSVVDHILEVGPHAALQGPLRDILRQAPRGKNIGYSSVLKRNKSATATILNVIGELFSMGSELDLRAANQSSQISAGAQSLLIDLPEYPFDHSQTYWYESRLSKNYRLRDRAPKELLGVRSNDWNSFDRRWRNFLRTAEMPWLEQHKIDGSILYPAAGMLVMAIEAAHEVASPERAIRGYVLRDVQLENAIILSTKKDALETQLSLRAVEGSSSNGSAFEFAIYSVEDVDWRRNCRGFIDIEFEDALDDWTDQQKSTLLSGFQTTVHDTISRCTKGIDSQHMYKYLEDCKLNYGPIFQAAQQQRISETQDVAANISLFHPAYEDSQPVQPHVIHPVSLDAMFHICFGALTAGGSKPMATSVPTRIGYMWLSNSGLSQPDSDEVTACCSITNTTSRGFVANCGVVDNTSTRGLKFFLEGIEMTNTTRTPPSIDQIPNPEQSYYNFDCQIALDKLKNEEIQNCLEKFHPADENLDEFFNDLSLVLEISLERLVASVDPSTFSETDGWRQQFWNWAQYQLEISRLKYPRNGSGTDFQRVSQSLDAVSQHLKDTNNCGRLFVEVAQQLVAIFKGEVEILDIMYTTDLGKDYYEETGHYKSALQAAKYVELLAHQNPNIKILEVGGGTGSGTRNIVKALKTSSDGESGSLRCGRYDFTDLSPSFLDKAREEFDEGQTKMSFRVLDLEKDFTEQGFESGSYDVVLAISCVHATSKIAQTLRHVRKSLKPGGKLIMQECFKEAAWTTGFVFGLYPGWWLGAEDRRVLSPNLSLEAWDKVLKETGFSGNDIVLRDFDSDIAHHYGFVISTAVEETPSIQPLLQSGQQPVIIVDHRSAVQSHLAQQLDDSLAEVFGKKPDIQTIGEVARSSNVESHFFIFLSDYGPLFLDSLDEKSWPDLQALLSTAQNLLWVSAGGDNRDTPAHGLLDGFCRSVRVERPDLHLVTLALDIAHDSANKTGHIMQVVKEMLSTPHHQNYEQEYLEIDGMLHTRRIVQAENLKDDINGRLAPYQDTTIQLSEATPFKLTINSPGQLDSLHYVEVVTTQEDVPANEVEILVRAIPMDSLDRALVTAHDQDLAFGTFCTGIVLRAGCDTLFAPGDRVFAIACGCFQSHARIPAEQVIKIPEELSFTEACTILPPVIAAHHALMNAGRARQDDCVLVQNGASPIGRAAIRLCQSLGVSEILTTADNERERDIIMSDLGLSDRSIMSKTSIDRQIKQRSRVGAVDIVLAVTSQEDSVQLVSCMKPFGRYIQLGVPAAESYNTSKSTILKSNAMLSLINLRDLIRERPSMLRESLAYAVEHVKLFDSRRSESFKIYPASEVVRAFETLADPCDAQQVVVEFCDDKNVVVKTATRPRYMLDANATYVIAGGLGGLGRCMARWLVARGARYLLLLSRSGPKTSEAFELMSELRDMGVHAEAPACDVSKRPVVEAMLQDCAQRMPAIKGCIQATMVQNENLFENMTFEQWKHTVDPKVAGSWNLHTVLPKNLEFFVMFSSTMGVTGGVKIANYGAANTYMDALARYRIAHGERAASLSIGGVLDEGWLATRAHLKDAIQRTKLYVLLCQQEITGLLDIYCDPETPLARSSTRCQPIIGLKPLSHALADGAELNFTMYQPMWQHMHQVPVPEKAGENSASSTARQRMQNVMQRISSSEVTSMVEAADLVSEALTQRVASFLGVPEDRMDAHKPMNTYGLDSLVAIDIRNWVVKTFDVDIAAFEILGGATSAGAAMSIASKVMDKKAKGIAEEK